MLLFYQGTFISTVVHGLAIVFYSTVTELIVFLFLKACCLLRQYCCYFGCDLWDDSSNQLYHIEVDRFHSGNDFLVKLLWAQCNSCGAKSRMRCL